MTQWPQTPSWLLATLGMTLVGLTFCSSLHSQEDSNKTDPASGLIEQIEKQLAADRAAYRITFVVARYRSTGKTETGVKFNSLSKDEFPIGLRERSVA